MSTYPSQMVSHRAPPVPFNTTTTCQSVTDDSPPRSSSIVSPKARLNNCDLLINVLECFMMKRIRENEENARVEAYQCLRYGRTVAEPSVFHALQAPSITPVEYLRRLARYSFCSRSVFVAAFLYLERIADMDTVNLRIDSLSVHRLVLTAVVLATKLMEDVLYDNAHFAKVGGVDVSELNMLELDMLKVLNFDLFIKPEEFEAFELVLLDDALNTQHPDYAILPDRLRNLGYDTEPLRKGPPASPTSSMDVSFITA